MISKTILSSTSLALMLLSPTYANMPAKQVPATSSSSSSIACGFHSGFRAGVGLGYQNYSMQNRYDYTIVNPAFLPFDRGELKQNGSTRQFALYQIHGAYDWIVNQMFVSLEIDYRYNPGVNKSRMTSNDFFLRNAPGDFVFEESHRHDFGLGVRVGRTLTPHFLVYGIANLRLGQFNYRFSSEKTNLNAAFRLQSGQNRQLRLGGGLGIGCQYNLGNGFSIGPEVTYDIYQSVKIAQNLTVNQNTATLYVRASRPKIFNAILKVSKTF